MPQFLKYLIAAVLAYLLGSVNISILYSKYVKRKDVRTVGSGNAGATNMLRTFGKRAAALALMWDVLKGIISVLLAYLFFGDTPYIALAAGAGAVLGHDFPVYFKFKGGKGILTSATVLGMIDWRALIVMLIIFIIVTALSKMVSLGSIAAGATVWVVGIFCGKDVVTILFLLWLGLFSVFMHRANIKRIINGTERKLGRANR